MDWGPHSRRSWHRELQSKLSSPSPNRSPSTTRVVAACSSTKAWLSLNWSLRSWVDQINQQQSHQIKTTQRFSRNNSCSNNWWLSRSNKTRYSGLKRLLWKKTCHLRTLHRQLITLLQIAQDPALTNQCRVMELIQITWFLIQPAWIPRRHFPSSSTIDIFSWAHILLLFFHTVKPLQLSFKIWKW